MGHLDAMKVLVGDERGRAPIAGQTSLGRGIADRGTCARGRTDALRLSSPPVQLPSARQSRHPSAMRNIPSDRPAATGENADPAASSPNEASAWKLSRYMGEIRTLPILTPGDELSLARRWQQHADVEAADKLVTSHLRLAARIAMGYRGYGLPLNDLIAEGNLGLVQAVKNFDPELGFRFATYATWWIRAAIQQYVVHSSSLVKMGTTAAQKKLFFNLRRLKSQMQVLDEGDLSPESVKRIAAHLGVPETDVVDMNRRLAGPDHSLNAPLGIHGEGERQDWLVDDTDDQEITLADRDELGKRRKLLSEAMHALNARERHIVTQRWLRETPTTLDELSQHHNISRERVRQIETRAFQKLRRAIVHRTPLRGVIAARQAV